MIEFNNIRLSLGLSWNEFYLSYLISQKSDTTGICSMSRNDLADNLGISKQAIIDLVKKLDRSGYVLNESGKLKVSDKWSRNFTDAQEFSEVAGKETLPPANLYGKETLPLSNSSDKESLPRIIERVKKLDHLPKDSGKETLPVKTPEVKKLYQQEEESTVLIQEIAENGKETLPPDPKSDLYIYTKDNILFNSTIKEEEKGSGEKQEKGKPFNIELNKSGISICTILRQTCKVYDSEHPDMYSPDMYKKFIQYWSDTDKKGVPKWYKELTAKKGTLSLPRRLSTWFENDQKFNKTSNGIRTNKGGSGTLRPTSIAEPSKRQGPGNVAHVEF